MWRHVTEKKKEKRSERDGGKRREMKRKSERAKTKIANHQSFWNSGTL